MSVVTPPLTPSSLLPSPSPSPAGQFEPLSGPHWFVTDDMEFVGRHTFERDETASDVETKSLRKAVDAMLLDVVTPPKGFRNIHFKDHGQQELRVEGSLTSLRLDECTSKPKTVAFRDSFSKLSPDLPSLNEGLENSSAIPREMDTLLESTIIPIALEEKNSVEREQLHDETPVSHVNVPVMDFTSSEPPWRQQLDSNSFISDFKNDYQDFCHWSGVRKVEHELWWMPFPRDLEKAAVDEEINDRESMASLLADLATSDVTEPTVTWKRCDLQVLNHDDTDDELDSGFFNADEDSEMSNLLRKRKKQYEGAGFQNGAISLLQNHFSPGQVMSSKSEVSGSWRQPEGANRLSDVFSATNAVTNFLNVRCESSKRRKVTDSSYYALAKASNPKSAEDGLNASTTSLHSQDQSATLLPVPELSPPSFPCPFVVSSAILTQRRFFRRLEQLLPAAELIERDFNKPLIPQTHSHNSQLRSLGSFTEDEADVIASPSTGILLTSLQKIKQRALPGQAACSVVQERIVKVARRYERLLVLVSEGRVAPSRINSSMIASAMTNGLDSKDCEALAELIGFVAGLEDNVIVMYVAGGEEELVKWLVGCMIQCSNLEQPFKLLQDETMVSIHSIFATSKKPSSLHFSGNSF
jgi:hypothetical protein